MSIRPLCCTRKPAVRRSWSIVSMADSIVGMPRDQSDALIETLCQATERPEHIYEHEWRVGDLLIWDNRATLHARTDFDPAERRVLRRLALRGERPIPAIPQEKVAS